MAWKAFWFDKNWALQKLNFPSLPLESDPVFLVGLWRSGTTYLHELLASHPTFYTPQTWQCFGASNFLTTGKPLRDQIVTRPMDHHVISNTSPQEDEFALMSLGIPSAYLGFFRPDLLDQLHYVLNPDFWLQEAGDNWGDEWLRFLQLLPHEPNQRLLLKSPNHLFRLPALTRMFPNAKWIYIFRDTDACLDSNRKMWQAMFDEYAVTLRSPASIDSFLQSACIGADNTLEWAMNHSENLDFISISLQELSQSPLDTLARLSDFLGIASGHDWTTALSRLAPPATSPSSINVTSSKTKELEASVEMLRNRHSQMKVLLGGR
jgi:hypothetical protein